MPKKIFIKTFGCQMNDHDSERMAGLMQKEGYALTGAPEEADIILVNTCSIRDKAEQKAYSELGRYAELKKEKADLIVGMTGCVAQQEGKKVFKRYPWVDLALGSTNIPNLPRMVKARLAGRMHVMETDVPPGPPASTPAVRKDRVRAWVNVMEGCDKRCAFCVVPTTRGPERSRPAEAVLSEVRELASAGYKEVTLLGQTVNSYGKGTPVEFPDLLWMLNDVPGIERIRFMTSHPADLTPPLMRAITMLPRVCNHLHLPMQSGSDRVLERMRRGYTSREYADRVAALSRMNPHIALSTDVIVGFPGETDGDFSATLGLLESVRFDAVYAFKFSPRPNTDAAAFPETVPEETKDARLQRLLSLQRGIAEDKNRRFIGTTQRVLTEGPSGRESGKLIGRAESNRTIRFEGTPPLAGSFVDVRIVRASAAGLEGELVR